MEGEEEYQEQSDISVAAYRVNSPGSDDEEEQDYDITLAASHSYMGAGMVEVPGRSVLEAGWQGKVLVVAHHGVVFPGETVPMLTSNSEDSLKFMEAVQQDRLFGLLCPDETGMLVSGYGVLCEVYEAGFLQDEAVDLSALPLKARAYHRFKFVEMPKVPVPIHMFWRARHLDVRVLPELCPGDPLQHSRLLSLDPHRRCRTEMDHRLRKMDSMGTPWPVFVYDILDYHRMREIIHTYFKSMNLKKLPSDPVSLSFYTASNLTLSPRERLALFMVDNALLRLYMCCKLVSRRSMLCCSSCMQRIARREHIFAMSSEGVHSNFSNLGGYMHDVVTVSQTTNTELSGEPTAQFSWFPGYKWTIALCADCKAHVGWRFDASKKNLRPQQFYGLCRNYVVPPPQQEEVLEANAWLQYVYYGNRPVEGRTPSPE